MFCSECGRPARGTFCSGCGTRLEPVEAAVEPLFDAPLRWEDEIRYDVVLQVPAVRAAVDRAAASAPKRMTGEQFLAVCDKLLSPPVSAETLAGVVSPFYARLGVGTGKARAERVAAPAGRTLCRLLCSLARNGQPVRNVRQAADGCVVEAELPSDLCSFAGDLIVTVRREPGGTRVEAATKIPGQFFDWGKSRRCLDRLFADLQAAAEPSAA